MPNEIGPYDGRRARRKRCDACVKRRIKCGDGIPCENCKRTGRLCTISTRPTILVPVFVGEKTKVTSKVTRSASAREDRTVIHLPRSVELTHADRAFPHFFVAFLPMNVLMNKSVEAEMLAMAKSSPALRDAVQAIATLHRQQQDQLNMVPADDRCETYHALQAYGRSVRYIQSRIMSADFLSDPTALWATFLLGLFELMRDSTGTNWLSHFLHGTCTILRLQRPESLACTDEYNLRKRRFFFATRIFEIARSLIYSSPTFLAEPEWIDALASMRKNAAEAVWHCKEALFDILPRVSDLSIRAIHFCEAIAQFPLQTQCILVQSFAKEGLLLQNLLQRWHGDAERWEWAYHNQLSTHNTPDTELLIGYVYYHAISIYLSGTFDYHTHWSWPGAPCAPILHRRQIELHVSEILRISLELLNLGVSGVLLFFPLRVAGARATDAWSRNTILDLLHITARRGFIVAEAFRVDLSNLWGG